MKELIMKFSLKQKWVHPIMLLNAVIFILFFNMSLVVDANGRFWGLSYTLSTTTAIAHFCIGIICSFLIVLLDYTKILLSIVCFIIYAIVLWPGLIEILNKL